MNRCPYCGADYPDNAITCPECGGRVKTRWESVPNICPACGYHLHHDQVECPVCHLKRNKPDLNKKTINHKNRKRAIAHDKGLFTKIKENTQVFIKNRIYKVFNKWENIQNNVQSFISDYSKNITLHPCPCCQEPIPVSTKICPYCETSLQYFLSQNICQNCNEHVSEEWKKCKYCNEYITNENVRYKFHYINTKNDEEENNLQSITQKTKYISASTFLNKSGIHIRTKQSQAFELNEDEKQNQLSDKPKFLQKIKNRTDLFKIQNILFIISIFLFIIIGTILIIKYFSNPEEISEIIVLTQEPTGSVQTEDNIINPLTGDMLNSEAQNQNNINQLEELRNYQDGIHINTASENILNALIDFSKSLNKNWNFQNDREQYIAGINQIIQENTDIFNLENVNSPIDANKIKFLVNISFSPSLKPYMMNCYNGALLKSISGNYNVYKNDEMNNSENTQGQTSVSIDLPKDIETISYEPSSEISFKIFESLFNNHISYSCNGTVSGSLNISYNDLVWVYRLEKIDQYNDRYIELIDNPISGIPVIKIKTNNNISVNLQYGLYFIGNDSVIRQWDRTKTSITYNNDGKPTELTAKSYNNSLLTKITYDNNGYLSRQQYYDISSMEYDIIDVAYGAPGIINKITELNENMPVKEINYFNGTYGISSIKYFNQSGKESFCEYYNRDGKTIKQEYYNNGVINQLIEYNTNGAITKIDDYKDGNLLRRMTIHPNRGREYFNNNQESISYQEYLYEVDMPDDIIDSIQNSALINALGDSANENIVMANTMRYLERENIQTTNNNIPEINENQQYIEQVIEEEDDQTEQITISPLLDVEGSPNLLITDDVRVLYIGNELTPESIITIEYYENYLLSRKYKFEHGGYPDNPIESSYYYYDENGHLTGEIKFNNAHIAFYQAIYEYYDDGKPYLSRHQENDNDPVSCYRFYDQEGRLNRRECYSGSELIENSVFTY